MMDKKTLKVVSSLTLFLFRSFGTNICLLVARHDGSLNLELEKFSKFPLLQRSTS